MHVEYDPYIIPVAQVGDILYSDKTFNPNYNSNKTPIAICVAPASHFQDGKARWMSLCNMSLADPEHGTTSTGNNVSNPGAGIIWGNDVKIGNTSIGLPSLLLPNVNKPTAELSSSPFDSGYISSDYFNSDNITTPVVDPFNSTLHYYGNYEDMDGSSKGAIPSPFKSDGSLNSINRLYALSEENGYALTNAIIEVATATETEGPITISSEAGHFPAAMACHRFFTESTSAGDWYLPSACELVYLMTHLSLINTKLTSIGDKAVCIGDEVTQDTLGNCFWSSSDYDSGNALRLYTSYGYLDNISKDDEEIYGRVRAFLAL